MILSANETVVAALAALAAAAGMSASAGICLLAHAVLAVAIAVFLRRSIGRGNVLVALHVTVVALFSLFAVYVLCVADQVIVEKVFDFRVFSEELIRRVIALNDSALGITALVYGLFAGLRRDSRLISIQELKTVLTDFARRPMFVPVSIAAGWMIIAWALVFTSNVTRAPYPENELMRGALSPSLRAALALISVGAATLRFMHDRYRMTFQGWILRLTAYASIFAVGLLGGPRGAMVGLLLGWAALDGAYGRGSLAGKALTCSLSVAYAVFAVVNWPYMRVTMSQVGFLPSFEQSFSQYAFLTGFIDTAGGVRLSDVPMLGQSLFHFLYSLALIDSGNSLHGQTFLNLLPQQLPEFLDGVLWTRPLNDNWLLADQFAHGGGFYSYANAYWNGGLAPFIAFSFVLALVIAKLELFFKELSIRYAPAYCVLIIMIPMGIYYGIQGLSRGIEFGLVAYLALRMLDPRTTRARARATEGKA